MRNRVVGWVCLWGIVLLCAPGFALYGAVVDDTEAWKNETFVQKAQAIKQSNWDKVSSRDVAMVQLLELGRMAERLERRLNAQTDRFYTLAYRGALVLGGFLLLHVALTAAILVRLAR